MFRDLGKSLREFADDVDKLSKEAEEMWKKFKGKGSFHVIETGGLVVEVTSKGKVFVNKQLVYEKGKGVVR